MPRQLLACLLTLCTCFAKDPPLVAIPDQGTIMGRELSRSRIQKIFGYFAVPYAQPPLGDLRFAAPVTEPLPYWEGVRNNTEYTPACLQTPKDYREEALPFLELLTGKDAGLEMQEDCLYLNVFVPFGSQAYDGFATIVWFHPGNFTTGSPSMWNPHTLVYRHRVILVTVAWRLSIMGFFTTGDGEASGNYGLMDQQAAMMWVKKNIKLFGGNDKNICLMGYGTGGASVGLHMVNPTSREYFSKAIAMSANFLSPALIKAPVEDKPLLDRLAESFGCIRNPTSRLIQCLRRADGALLVQETSNINWRPIVDAGLSNNTSAFLSDLPRVLFERDDFHKIPFLTGYTNMEEILSLKNLDAELAGNASTEFLQLVTDIVSADIPVNNNTEGCLYNYEHITDAVMFFYGPPANIQDMAKLRKVMADFTTERNYASNTFQQAKYLSGDQPTFVYRFDIKPATKFAVQALPQWVSVPHLFDLIYVWGMPYWLERESSWELRDKRFSDIIMSFWTNFAKSSSPTEGLLYPIQWEPFTAQNTQILIIDSAFNMSNDRSLNYKAFEFWNDYYPKVLEIATQCCNATDGGTVPLQMPLTVLVMFLFIYKML